MIRELACTAAALILAAPAAMAQDLVYTPVNPSFGGNPLNSSHLLAIANAQRQATARDADDGSGTPQTPTTPGSDNADLFVRQLEGRLLSALAAQVTDAIFRQPPSYESPWQISMLVLLGLIALSISVLERRVKGVEVVS